MRFALVVGVFAVATLAPLAGSTLAAELDGPSSAHPGGPPALEPVPAAAECSPSALLPVGTRVRVYSTALPSQPVEGKIVCVSEVFVRVQPDEGPTITLDREAISSIDVLSASHSRGRRRSRVDGGAAIGAVTLGFLGGSLGVLAGAALQHDSGERGWEEPALAGVIGAAGGAHTGALIGALVGAVIPAHTAVAPTVLRPSAVLAVYPTRSGGAGAAVTISF